MRMRPREKLAARAGFVCFWCNQPTRLEMGYQNSATVEHLIPKSRGGSDSMSNLRSACYRCNTARGNTCSQEFALKASAFSHDQSKVWADIPPTPAMNRIQRKQTLIQNYSHKGQFSYLHVPDQELDARGRMRKDRSIVMQAIKVSAKNPFEPGSRKHRMFEKELERLTPVVESQNWFAAWWHKLTEWCGLLYAAIIPGETQHENRSRQ